MSNGTLNSLIGTSVVAALLWGCAHNSTTGSPQADADAPATTSAAARVTAPTGDSVRPVSRPTSVVARVFHDEVHFVAQEDAYSYVLNAPVATQIKIVVDIDNAAPIELRVYKGDLSGTDYALSSDPQLQVMGALVNVLMNSQEESSTDVAPSEPKPELAFLQRGVYRHFESEWIPVQAGDYSVIADNTGFHSTPSRGDVPVRLRVMERTVL